MVRGPLQALAHHIAVEARELLVHPSKALKVAEDAGILGLYDQRLDAVRVVGNVSCEPRTCILQLNDLRSSRALRALT